jgi:CrcB protein
MTQLLAIAIAGAIGALLRFWMSGWVYGLFGRDFPYGTLAVNVAGSLLMGVSFVLLVERLGSAPEWRALVMIGFLGAFTTFSTFSLETVQLLEGGAVGRAMINVLGSVVFCLVATWLGIVLGRQL